MSRKLICSPSAITRHSQVDHLGNCVYCKLGIFSDQQHGRALRPLIGKAHTDCIPKPAPVAVPEPGLVAAFNSDVDLTRREREIVQLVGCGLTQRQIAERLWISLTTVSTHMDHVRSKLRVHTAEAAARAALNAGLIPVLEAERFPAAEVLEAERHGAVAR